jgi:glycosyltransferase involved in cell wall biosynthesis
MPELKNTKTLYICYFGLREPLVQTQVLPYLRELRDGGIKVFLLTFEPNAAKNWSNEDVAKQKKDLAAEGIEWAHLAYHKNPSVAATFFDIICGAWFARKLVRREKIDVIHGRSHVATLMGALVKKVSSRPLKLIFDIRGLLAEEYTDAGNWKEGGLLYRTVKKVERRLFKTSDAFVVLTERVRDILFPGSRETGFDAGGRPVEVIPCCVDIERFEAAGNISRDEVLRELGLENRLVIAYVGSFGGWYMARETADFFKAARDHNDAAFALILTQSSPETIRPLLLERGYTESDFLIKKVSPAKIPRLLRASDLALSFIKPCYSKLSSSPTKIAEYLASGVPLVSNKNIGDVDALIAEDKVGVLIEDFSQESYLETIKELEDLYGNGKLAENCRQSAKNRFDLKNIGGVRYRRLYEKTLGSNKPHD